MPRNPEYEVFARAASTSAASKSASDDTRGCWHPRIVTAGANSKVAFDGFATGEGIVIGVIDTGIDVSFPGFLTVEEKRGKAVFSSRIAVYWDQFTNPARDDAAGWARTLKWFTRMYPERDWRTSAKTLIYGTFHEAADIEKALAARFPAPGKLVASKSLPSPDIRGHGTACAALAASHGFAADTALSEPIGIAPLATLVAVKYIGDCAHDTTKVLYHYAVMNSASDIGPGSDDRERDAVRFCLAAGRHLHQPAEKARVVINQSYGQYVGRPVSDLPDSELDQDDRARRDLMEDARDEVLVFTSAGNEGYPGLQARASIKRGSLEAGEFATIGGVLFNDRSALSTKPAKGCKNSPASDMSVASFAMTVFSESAAAPDIALFAAPFDTLTEIALTRSGDTWTGKIQLQKSGKGAELNVSIALSHFTLPVSQEVHHFSCSIDHVGIGSGKTASRGLPSGMSLRLGVRPIVDCTFLMQSATSSVRVDRSVDPPQIIHKRGLVFSGGLFRTRRNGSGAPTSHGPPAGADVSLERRHRIVEEQAWRNLVTVGATVLGRPRESSLLSNAGPMFSGDKPDLVPLKPDVTAPGQTVKVAYDLPRDGSGAWVKSDKPHFAVPSDMSFEQGTSLSSPIAAGVAALAWSVDLSQTAGAVRGIVESTADGSAWNPAAGTGSPPPPDADQRKAAFAALQGRGPVRAHAAAKAAAP